MGIKNLKSILVHSKNIVRHNNVDLNEFLHHFDFMQILYNHLYSTDNFSLFYERFKLIFAQTNKFIYIDSNYDNPRKLNTKIKREKVKQYLLKRHKEYLKLKSIELKDVYEFKDIETFVSTQKYLITEIDSKYFQYMITIFGIKNLSSIVLDKLISDNIISANELIYEDVYDAETRIVIDIKSKFANRNNNIVSEDQDVLFFLYHLKVDKCLISSPHLNDFKVYKFSIEGLNISKLCLICNISDYWDGINGIEFNINNYNKFNDNFIITIDNKDMTSLEILKNVDLNFIDNLKLFSIVRKFNEEKYNKLVADFNLKFKDLKKYLKMEKNFYYK